MKLCRLFGLHGSLSLRVILSVYRPNNQIQKTGKNSLYALLRSTPASDLGRSAERRLTMHTFAQKPKAAQQTTSAKSTIPGRGHFGHSPVVRSIGNQAVQRMLKTDADEAEVKSTGRVTPRFGHDFSLIPIHPPAAGAIQTKLAINEPGDSFEQEADRVADMVMRMPEPTVQRECATCGGKSLTDSECPECEKKKQGLGGTLQRLSTLGDSAAGMAAPPIVSQVLSSSGQPLPAHTRAFMEERFGHDFSRVRVHADAAAEQSARDVNAHAYTVGHNIVFGAGQFAPGTSAGRRLMAHELTHVVQQSRTPSAPHPLLQRDIGAEFQLRDNTIKTNTGRTFGRKEGKFFHRVPAGDKHGLELQTETGSFMEFETHHFQKFSDLKAQVQAAVDVVNDIKKAPKAFPFNQEARLRKEGVLKKGETLEVDILDSAFNADIQTTEGIALSQYSSLLKEHERNRAVLVDPVLADAQTVLTDAMAASKSVKAGANVDNLRGFLQLILNYVRRGQTRLWDKSDHGAVKATFRLMMRTNFALAFSQILTKDEQSLFRDIVKTDAIPKAVGIAATDPFFKTGYWGDLDGQHALFERGKVTALEKNGTIHDCSSATKTAGVDSKRCNAKIAGTDITVGGWLKSIVLGKQDLLSPAAHGSSSMGQLLVSKQPAEKGLAVFEVRGTEARTRTQPASKWVDYIDEVFSQAAACRARAGKTNLNYDGSKPFAPTNCP